MSSVMFVFLDKIVVGSHSGILRIYNPSGADADGTNHHHATDLLLEKNLGMPIVQVEIGNFVRWETLLFNEHQLGNWSQLLLVSLVRRQAIRSLFCSLTSSVFMTITVCDCVQSYWIKDFALDYRLEQSGMTEHGRQTGLELNYEHNMNRPTFNMCKGHFGGGRGSKHAGVFLPCLTAFWLAKDSSNHEYLCVQTLDGVLFVFEHERQSMVKSLPNTYLPGPLAYLARSDAVLTVSSNHHLECYKSVEHVTDVSVRSNQCFWLRYFRYQTLAISSGTDTGSSDNNDARRKGIDADPSLSLSQSSSKRVLPEWTFNLGECALAIQVAQRVRGAPQTILVLGKPKREEHCSIQLNLGERNLFCLNDNGQLTFMSKFEYNPSTFVVYGNDTPANGEYRVIDYDRIYPRNSSAAQSETSPVGVRYIVGTHSHTLYISQDAHIRWAAHVDTIPVQIDVCTLQ